MGKWKSRNDPKVARSKSRVKKLKSQVNKIDKSTIGLAFLIILLLMVVRTFPLLSLSQMYAVLRASLFEFTMSNCYYCSTLLFLLVFLLLFYTFLLFKMCYFLTVLLVYLVLLFLLMLLLCYFSTCSHVSTCHIFLLPALLYFCHFSTCLLCLRVSQVRRLPAVVSCSSIYAMSSTCSRTIKAEPHTSDRLSVHRFNKCPLRYDCKLGFAKQRPHTGVLIKQVIECTDHDFLNCHARHGINMDKLMLFIVVVDSLHVNLFQG